MSSPPPIPTPVRSGKGIPGWILAGILGVPLLVLVAGANINWGKGDQLALRDVRPRRGVPLTQPDEQLFVGNEGEFRYRNKTTGAERVVWNEGSVALKPHWLAVPAKAERRSASGRRGGGRKEALFVYHVTASPAQVVGFYLNAFPQEGLSVLQWSLRGAVNGADAQREAFVRVENGELYLHITEPDKP